MYSRCLLKKHYENMHNNFLTHFNINKILTIKLVATKLSPYLGLSSGRNLKMFDIGDGGGIFCRTFEYLGYGAGTYVDLNLQSCNFAENSLNLKKIFNCYAIDMEV